jgi:hypothetical protein
VGKELQVRAANVPGKEGAPAFIERTSRINVLHTDANCMPSGFGTAVPLLPARMTPTPPSRSCLGRRAVLTMRAARRFIPPSAVAGMGHRILVIDR